MTDRTDLTCDVLVVGAGPTGLTLATALASRGVSVRIIDRQAEGANTSRAAVVHARTLEMLERIAVAGRLVARGLQCRTFSIRDRDRTLIALDFSRLASRYPYMLMVSQAVTEAVLLDRLREAGGDVNRPCELAGVSQGQGFVDALFDDGRRLRARYLVGADGMHSKVRDLAGIEFAGEMFSQSFLLADVRLAGGIPRDEVALYFSPAGMAVLAPLPGGMHRFVASVDEAPESPGAADVQELLDDRGPQRDPAIVERALWGSRFRVHHRLAKRYAAGRILLAGDAAHVHSPAGGQGMNTGIQDAIALAGALTAALERNDPAALERYSGERRAVAERVLSLSSRLTRMATIGSGLRPLRNAALRALGCSAPFRRTLALRLAGLG